MMKDRIMQIMKQENMSQQDFAAALDVSPSSLSSIFNGRTNPTSKHVSAIHRRFPQISINWLMFGEGDMYVNGTSGTESGTDHSAADHDDSHEQHAAEGDRSSEAGVLSNDTEPAECLQANAGTSVQACGGPIPMIRETVRYIDKPQRKITEIRIFFDDGTYEVFKGNVN